MTSSRYVGDEWYNIIICLKTLNKKNLKFCIDFKAINVVFAQIWGTSQNESHTYPDVNLDDNLCLLVQGGWNMTEFSSGITEFFSWKLYSWIMYHTVDFPKRHVRTLDMNTVIFSCQTVPPLCQPAAPHFFPRLRKSSQIIVFKYRAVISLVIFRLSSQKLRELKQKCCDDVNYFILLNDHSVYIMHWPGHFAQSLCNIMLIHPTPELSRNYSSLKCDCYWSRNISSPPG